METDRLAKHGGWGQAFNDSAYHYFPQVQSPSACGEVGVFIGGLRRSEDVLYKCPKCELKMEKK